jgi:RimJ/RimL family protein N-acetyltransferase
MGILVRQGEGGGGRVRRDHRSNATVRVVRSDLLISGERVALGPLRADLAPAYARWFNDPEVRQGILRRGIKTAETEAAWATTAMAAAAEPRPTVAHFTVYDVSDFRPVGATDLFEIDHLMGRAGFGIVIGERRGRGLGTEATRLVLRWAFEVLGLHNVLLGAWASNDAALRAYERAGFREIGRRREALRHAGGRCDEVLMDAVAPAVT